MAIIVRLVWISILLCGSLMAQDDISADGEGLGSNREEALLGAKRNAIEKGIGTILISQTEIENFMTKRDQIITKTVGAVKNYEITAETKTSDNLIKINIKAILSRTAVHADLAAAQILIESMNKPRIMILVAEDNMSSADQGSNAAEIALTGFLKDPYDFDLIDVSVASTIKASQQKMAMLANDAAAAAQLGTQYGAEVLITGKAISRKAEGMSAQLGGMISAQADVTLKAINCSNAKIIGSSDAHAARVHINPSTAGSQAIAKASTIAAQKLLDAIMKDWQNQSNNGIGLSVTIANVATFKVKKDVIICLESIMGVSAVRERSWDAAGKQLIIDIQYKGNASGFCDKADGRKMKSGTGSVSVSGIEGSRVNLIAQVL